MDDIYIYIYIYIYNVCTLSGAAGALPAFSRRSLILEPGDRRISLSAPEPPFLRVRVRF